MLDVFKDDLDFQCTLSSFAIWSHCMPITLDPHYGTGSSINKNYGRINCVWLGWGLCSSMLGDMRAFKAQWHCFRVSLVGQKIDAGLAYCEIERYFRHIIGLIVCHRILLYDRHQRIIQPRECMIYPVHLACKLFDARNTFSLRFFISSFGTHMKTYAGKHMRFGKGSSN